MKMKYSMLAASIALQTALLSGTAYAAATAEELAELGNSRTCVGALKAGNADAPFPSGAASGRVYLITSTSKARVTIRLIRTRQKRRSS